MNDALARPDTQSGPLDLDPRALRAIAGPVVLGLSGGGDSTALLHALAKTPGLTAVVVDHALRAGSHEDAAHAAGFAARLGVPAQIVTLHWPSGAKRSQAALRRARHSALYAAARARGASVIALAHTADDQAETVLMRAARSGWRVAVAMAPVAPAPIWPEGRGLILVRPLLHMRRAALRAWLAAHGGAWIEDPGNENPAYERVRVRRRLAQTPDAVARLVRLAERVRARADRSDAYARAWLAGARFAGPDVIVGVSRLAEPAAPRALQVLIAAAAGAAAPPPIARVRALAARAREDGFRGATLGGARLVRIGDALRLTRDPGAVLGRGGSTGLAPLPLPAGEEVVWDGRLALTAAAAGWRAQPAASGALPAVATADRALPLAEAAAAGLMHAEWLVRARAAALLGGATD